MTRRVTQGGRGRLGWRIRHGFGGGRERRPADDHLRMGRGDAERAEGHGGGPGNSLSARFRLAAYDGARVVADGVIHFAEGDAKVELLNDMRYLAYGNLPKTKKSAGKTTMCRRGLVFSSPRSDTLFRAGRAAFGGSQPQGLSGPRQDYPRAGKRQRRRSARTGAGVRPIRRLAADSQYHIDGDHYRIGWIEKARLPAERRSSG